MEDSKTDMSYQANRLALLVDTSYQSCSSKAVYRVVSQQQDLPLACSYRYASGAGAYKF